MIRLIVEQTFQNNKLYVEGFCTSNDTKPTSGIVTGSKITEVDTGDVYVFDETGDGVWYPAAGSNNDSGLPIMDGVVAN